ncbi:MAG: PEP-utilizing enzyme [Patescibacteria group bacterium]
MIEKLFSSQVTFSLLSALFKQPNRPLPTTELVATTGKNQANIQRELDKLSSWGLVIKTKKANQNSYSLNTHYQSFNALKDLFAGYHQKSKKYILLNEENGVCVLSVDYVLKAYASDYGVKKGIIDKAWDCLAVYKNDYGRFYFDQATVEYGEKRSLKKLLKDPSFVFEIIYPESLTAGEEAQRIFKKLYRDNFHVTKPEAIKLFDKFLEIITIQVGLNTIAVFDLKDQLYSNYLKKYLTEKTKKNTLSLNYAMEKLLAPEKLTYTQLLRLELLKLAVKYHSRPKDATNDLKILQSKWGWLNYGYVGPGLDLAYFTQVFKELSAKTTGELNKEIAELNDNEARVKTAKKEIYQQLKIDVRHQKFIDALNLLSYLKVNRKDTMFLALYCIYEIFAQLLPDYRQKDLFNLTIAESKDLLLGRLKAPAKELAARSNYCAYIYSENKFFYGAEVDKLLKAKVVAEEAGLESNNQLKLLDGTAACLGKTGNWVYGEVRIINSAADMSKMKEGDILVSVATTPDILAAMKKAAAIVTDHGGITCHAAIVSRELNIPCLIATKYATRVFKDGDKVIVCPRHGYIKFQ